MTRYCIVATNFNLQQVIEEVKAVDGHNIKVAKYPDSTSASGDSPVENVAGMVFADLSDIAVNALKAKPGLMIRDVTKTKSDKLRSSALCGLVTPPAPPTISSLASHDSNTAILLSKWSEFRNSFNPPLTGSGLTCAVIGSGIRKTHRTLRDKVVYEANFSSSPTLDDVFGHDTSVAYLIAGGGTSQVEESGMAPGAHLWNIKCLDDSGEGTSEDLILAMAHVQELYEKALYAEVPVGDSMYLNAVNISLGAEDDGDLNNPIRIAAEKLYHSSPGRFPLFASAGNQPTFCALPAAHEHVWAVGCCKMAPFELSEFSARGCKTGIVKPEMVMYGENLLMASSTSDDAFVVKSGTSFSSPLCLGILCLIREAASRLGQLENVLYVPFEDLEPYVSKMCVKPNGNPQVKEDGWGYGLPMGDLFVKEFQGGGVNVNQLLESLVPMMMAIPMMGLMAKMTKQK